MDTFVERRVQNKRQICQEHQSYKITAFSTRPKNSRNIPVSFPDQSILPTGTGTGTFLLLKYQSYDRNRHDEDAERCPIVRVNNQFPAAFMNLGIGERNL